jgi:hypothetical protein
MITPRIQNGFSTHSDALSVIIALLFINSFAVTQVYYSVGANGGADLKNGSTIIITSGIATFSNAQPNNVGVGDQINYDATNKIAYISGRTSSTVYTVVTSKGLTPANLSTYVVVNSIKRAFNNLNNTVNTSVGGAANSATFLNTNDLANNDYDLNITCYADAPDVGSATIYNWNTDATHYIKIYTPVSSGEVGVSQRHNGYWLPATTAYTISTTAGSQFVVGILNNFVKIHGLQVSLTGVTTADAIRIDNQVAYLSASAVIEVAYNLITSSSAVSNIGGVSCWPNSSPGANITLKIWNNIIWNLVGGGSSGMYLGCASAPTSYVYNNTIYNCDIGIVSDNGTVVVKNDLIYATTTPDGYQSAAVWGGPLGTFVGTNDLSGPTADPDMPAANGQNGVAVVFEDPTNSDFRLSSADVNARTKGTNLFADANLSFTDDITGDARPSTWDIGARQWNDATSTQLPTLLHPATGTTGNKYVSVDFTLPEAALGGSVKMTFTQTGGTADGVVHVVVFKSNFETAGEHTTTMDGINMSANANVSSANGALVNGSIYSARLEYRDALGNPVAAVLNTNYTYSTAAVNPTLAAPATNGRSNAALSIDFTLPLAANSGTVKMTFTQTSGTADAGSPHVLTFASSYESAAQHQTTINGGALGADPSKVVALTGGASLADGAIYSVKLEYNPGAGVQSVTNANFTYDITAPTFVGGYPATGTIDGTSIQFLVKINENGKAYFILMADPSTTPSSANVKAGLNSAGTTAGVIASGNVAASANIQEVLNATGLTSGIKYDAYIVAEDLLANIQAAPNASLTPTTVDNTPPVNAGGYPVLGTVGGTTAQFKVKTNENGNAYFVVATHASGMNPTSAQVKAGQDGPGHSVNSGWSGSVTIAANTEGNFTAINLNPSTAYDVFIVAEDGVPNLQVAPSSILNFSTSGASAPVTASTYPKMYAVTATAAQFATNINETGTAYYVVMVDPATAPSAANVKAGFNSSGNSTGVIAHGSASIATANAEVTFPASPGATGLTTGTLYDVFIVAEDATGTQLASVATLTFTPGNQGTVTWSRRDLICVRGTAVGETNTYVGAGNTLYGLNTTTGAQVFAYNSGQGSCGQPTYDYVSGTYRIIVCQGNYLIRYDDPGGLKWSVNLGAQPSTPFISVDDNSAFVLLANNTLTKRSITNGARDGTFGSGSDVSISKTSLLGSLTVYSGYVLVSSSDGVVSRVDAATGNVASTYSTGSNVSINQPLLSYNNVLYVAPSTNTLYAVNATNLSIVNWAAGTSLGAGNTVTAAPMADFSSSLSKIYLATGTKVQCVTDNGSSGTAVVIKDVGVTIESGPIVYNGYVYFGRDNGQYYAIRLSDQSNAVNWPYLNASGNAVLNPAIDPIAGKVVFGTDAGDLHVFGTQ